MSLRHMPEVSRRTKTSIGPGSEIATFRSERTSPSPGESKTAAIMFMGSHHGETAVHVKGNAGDEARSVRGQKNRCSGYLVNRAIASDGMQGGELRHGLIGLAFLHPLRKRTSEGCIDNAGCDTVRAQPLLGVVEGDALRQVMKSRLGHVVRDVALPGDRSRYRSH